jgi:hypothetical protein
MMYTFLTLGLLSSAPVLAQDTFTDNVVIVLDASGSMSNSFPGVVDSRWAAATTAIEHVVAEIPETTQLGLVVFSAKGSDTEWVVPLGPNDSAAVVEALGRLRPHGGTPLGEFIKVGADRLLAARAEQHGYGTYRLLVVTDGRAGDPKKVDVYSEDLLQRGVVLDVIGVAMKNDHQLKQVAHSYRRADDPKQLLQAVKEVLAEVPLAGDAGASADAFTVTDNLPDNFVFALIEEFTTFQNHPIGEAPPAPSSGAADTVPAPAPAPVPAPVPPTGSSCSVTSGVAMSFGSFAGLLVLARRRR